jgi:hypothetical protein
MMNESGKGSDIKWWNNQAAIADLESHEAALRSAMLYSLMGTCKLHGVNPFDWLKNILEIIPAHPINKIQKLLPYNWKFAHNYKNRSLCEDL